MKMWKGPGRDRKRLEMTKDASGYAVVPCKYPLVRDLLLLAEREKNPIGDMTEVALAAKAGLPLLLHDNLAPTRRGLELWRKLHDVRRDSSECEELHVPTP